MNTEHVRALLYCALPNIALLEGEKSTLFLEMWREYQSKHVFDKSLTFTDVASLRRLLDCGYTGLVVFDTVDHVLRGHMIGSLTVRADGHYDFTEVERYIDTGVLDDVIRRGVILRMSRQCIENIRHQLSDRADESELRGTHLRYPLPIKSP